MRNKNVDETASYIAMLMRETFYVKFAPLLQRMRIKETRFFMKPFNCEYNIRKKLVEVPDTRSMRVKDAEDVLGTSGKTRS